MSNFKFLNDVIDWIADLIRELRQHPVLIYGLTVAIATSLVFGIAFAILDPNVHSVGDGLWYAWVTMTHVGYGDVVPTSLVGRVLASILILLGLGVLALLTAAFSALLLNRKFHPAESDPSRVLAEIERLHKRLDQLEATLKPAARSRRSPES